MVKTKPSLPITEAHQQAARYYPWGLPMPRFLQEAEMFDANPQVGVNGRLSLQNSKLTVEFRKPPRGAALYIDSDKIPRHDPFQIRLVHLNGKCDFHVFAGIICEGVDVPIWFENGVTQETSKAVIDTVKQICSGDQFEVKDSQEDGNSEPMPKLESRWLSATAFFERLLTNAVVKRNWPAPTRDDGYMELPFATVAVLCLGSDQEAHEAWHKAMAYWWKDAVPKANGQLNKARKMKRERERHVCVARDARPRHRQRT